MNTPGTDNAAFAGISSSTGRWSLRTRLIMLLLVATSGLWVLASYSVYRETEIESQELFDDSLKETAYLLLAVVQHEMAEHGIGYTAQMIDSTGVPDTHYLRFQIWSRDGRLIYRSKEAPERPMARPDSLGYAWATGGAEALRTYVAWNADRQLQIQIGEPLSHRREIIQRTLWRLALFAALFLPLTAFLIWWIIARSFEPIRWSSEAVAERTGQHLDDVGLDNVPREIVPLIRAINQLLGRIRATLEHERRFTADAAHELRTPLAAIRAHAQVLQGARNTDEASEAARDIIAGVDRSRRLVDQLLALARLDEARLDKAQALPKEPVDLAALVRQQVHEHRAFAERQQITLIAEPRPAVVQGHADHLNVLLRNLIDNALRYTPAGGVVRVGCGIAADGEYLSVRDSGVGIPKSERRRIFERFYRINRLGGDRSYGSGLGLSIVQRLVEQYGARISIGDGLNGAGVGFAVHFTRTAESWTS